ncbi:uncharacterized protein A1O9_10482 [Exophiala aquamarina CBS 119918]|uniref:VOC domain-containing protein n=1 Tax=Exophiala aquamarina CBS 119918 TaxID=1182545 RepID=A0A072P1F1_9EURO|nr:uncharacterized protein A1O9_10482 [Exophiala aquamarina CBS 119918]KEF53507.1 hypothetical protein A1O9_10482 [Exophiala aquamarina CBS 119918]
MAADESTEKLISPTSMGHFGVRTPPEHYQAMVKWHLDFFGGKTVWQNDVATMITFDDEHHREVIVSDAAYKLIEDRRHAAGIYHIAFNLPTLADLATSYEQKKARGIVPHWPVNHGMTTSMYYFDPTGNEFELQVNNFDTTEEARQFMESAEFKENSIGVDLVVDDWIKKVRSCEDESDLKKRPIIGRRQSRWENSIYFKLEDK